MQTKNKNATRFCKTTNKKQNTKESFEKQK